MVPVNGVGAPGSKAIGRVARFGIVAVVVMVMVLDVVVLIVALVLRGWCR